MGGNRAVGNGGNDLTKNLGPYVTDRINTVYIGFCRFVGNYIALGIKLHRIAQERGYRLSADAYKQSVAIDPALVTVVDVQNGHTADSAVAFMNFCNTAVPNEFNVFRLHKRLVIYLCCP